MTFENAFLGQYRHNTLVMHPILLSQALEYVEYLYSQSLSHIRLFATQWTVAHQVPLSVGLSWQEYWSGLLFPSL